jgi:pimeloyl-ACP methyl ester carboxylesterase
MTRAAVGRTASTPLACLSLLFALVLAGCAARPAIPPSPAPMLFTDCRGQPSAAPTVILESGAFGTSADWDRVMDDLARGGRVCAYDRGGVGRSPPRTGGQDVTAIAQELAGLLDSMGETRPVILVGHSNGALYVETFAALWPQRVAGLAYVNGVTSDDLDYPVLIADLTRERRLASLAVTAGDVGLAPAVARILTGATGLRGRGLRRKQEALDNPAALRVARDEDRAVIPGLATARRLGGPPPGIPIAVIEGSTAPNAPLFKAWRAAETASAARARTAWVMHAPGATHTSPLARDRAYVVAAVEWLRSAAGR